MFALLKCIRDCFNYYIFGRLAPEMIEKINSNQIIEPSVKENLIASIMTNNPTQLLEQLNDDNNNIPSELKTDLNASIMIATQPEQKTNGAIIKEFTDWLTTERHIFGCDSHVDIMWYACRENRVDVINAIVVNAFATRQTISVTDLDVGLTNACQTGQYDAAKLMLDLGVRDLYFPIRQACQHGYINIVRLLLKYSAHP